MKNTIKIIMLFALIMLALLCIPSISKAAETETPRHGSNLISGIQNVNEGGTVDESRDL